MVNYIVTVHNSNRYFSNTYNSVFITLVGHDCESEKTPIPGSWIYGVHSDLEITISCPTSLGELTQIILNKNSSIIDDKWLPSKIDVRSPEGTTFTFPVYRWITDGRDYTFREGKALTVQQDKCCKSSRAKELAERAEEYRWEIKKGLPGYFKEKENGVLPAEVSFSFKKDWEFKYTALRSLFRDVVLSWLPNPLGIFLRWANKWKKIDNITDVFNKRFKTDSDTVEYVHKHWKDDEFFGYQFLNGINPMVIRRCTALPDNFPVPNNIVFPHGPGDLAKEMEQNKIFLCDYKILDGIPTNVINGKEQYLMAPLVLLHKTEDDKMMPIAIQLRQKPADDNPIFFHTDSEYDWLLAKIFVRSADFNLHEINFHLLRTHLLAEVFAVSLLRNIPMVHPLYKLLIPHTRYTLHINMLARDKLISPTGVLTSLSAAGGKGLLEILAKSLSSLTYTSLCIPDDIAERGLEDVKKFYYKEDGIVLWDIIHGFVTGILEEYYKADSDVLDDPELQKWIGDIFEYGFHSETTTGIPQKFTSVNELIKFVTMVIFTGSAQHAAVNSGQYDYGAWMPNSPISLQSPPPTKKGEATENTMLATFPDVKETNYLVDTVYLLSNQSSDFVSLDDDPEHYFTEESPKLKIIEFQAKLQMQSDKIKNRNDDLKVKGDLPYTYLHPRMVEKSVAI